MEHIFPLLLVCIFIYFTEMRLKSDINQVGNELKKLNRRVLSNKENIELNKENIQQNKVSIDKNKDNISKLIK